ncbi:hypothetical protein MTP04_02360 [Lysinibacillus sp. PLM2]|nr:hypothetical protein MTP04_02360 [Lysinibacillus sp. PLM2]
MNESYIIDQLILNGFNYHRFGDEQFKDAFSRWMYKLQDLKGFKTIDETCEYFLNEGKANVA